MKVILLRRIFLWRCRPTIPTVLGSTGLLEGLVVRWRDTAGRRTNKQTPVVVVAYTGSPGDTTYVVASNSCMPSNY